MPLLDHFHPPLSVARHWQSLHTLWTGALTGQLNQGALPPGCFAEAQVNVGGGAEIDVATFEPLANGASSSPVDGGVATRTAPAWAPPVPALSMPALFPDDLEVLVFRGEGGPTLIGAIELISPSNKDRPDYRSAFAIKCANFLHQGIGLVIVDVVTSRQANLHDEVVGLMGQLPACGFPGGSSLYAVSYQPVRRQDRDLVDIWPVPLFVGQSLPMVPLPLRGFGCVRLDLEASYTEARQRNGLG